MGLRERVAGLLHRTGLLDVALWAGAGRRHPAVSVFTFHHVAEPGAGYPFDPEVADTTPRQFHRQLELLGRRFSVVGIDDLCRALDGAPLPRNPALITFDDGYRSCHDVALPLLRKAGLRAVFFVATSFVESRRLYWWERIAWLVARSRAGRVRLAGPLPLELDLSAPGAAARLCRAVKDTPGLDLGSFLESLAQAAGVTWTDEIERRLADELIMTWDQVRVLRDAGMDVESHSRRHRVLQTLTPPELEGELAGAKVDLERQLGRSVRAIAYPVGRSIAGRPALRAAVAGAGYRIGFTNGTGRARLGQALDPLDFPRIAVDRAMSDAMLLGQAAFPALGYPTRRASGEAG
jgi:peptidoglycan/xylan/chitin deacetylase (PgdA/CDA1 family)